MLIHVLGCGLYAVVILSKDKVDQFGNSLQWYPPLHWVNYSGSDFFSEETPLFSKMLISLYYAVLMMGLNELGPVNFEEYLFVTLALIITSIVNA